MGSRERSGRGARRDRRSPGAAGLDGVAAFDESDQPGDEADASAGDPYEAARAIALRLLDARDYTRAELAARLARRNVPLEVTDEVLDRFEEVRLLDDARYAERYATSRQAARSLSRSAVRRELLTKGVDPELVDTAVAAIDDDTEHQAALDLAQRKVRSMRNLPRETQYRRLAGALARKGYAGHQVHSVVAEVLDGMARLDEGADLS